MRRKLRNLRVLGVDLEKLAVREKKGHAYSEDIHGVADLVVPCARTV
jgi:hypothetical protein